MALWGKTDALASVPKYIARTATVAAAKINATDDTIDISLANTGFNTGDQVAYTGDAATPGNYFVRVVSAGVVSLYGTAAQAAAGGATGKVNLSAGSGNHSLQATGVQGNITAGGQQIVFVDAQEAQVAANKAKGITGAGWWRFITYTDAQSSTRTKAECLVAMAVAAGDASDREDTIAVDLVITIGTQPQSDEITSGDDVTLTVAATINGAVPLTYQWYDASDDSAVEGATSASLALTDVTVAASYYVIVSGGGVTATSETADITIAA